MPRPAVRRGCLLVGGSLASVLLLVSCSGGNDAGGDDAGRDAEGATPGGDVESGTSAPNAGDAGAEGAPTAELCDVLDGQEIGSLGLALLQSTVVVSDTARQRSCRYAVGQEAAATLDLALTDVDAGRAVMEQSVQDGDAVEVPGIGQYAVFDETGGLRIVLDDDAWLVVNVAVAGSDGGAVSDRDASEAAAEIAVPQVTASYR